MIGKERCDETKIGKLEKWKEYTESVLFTVPAILLVTVMMYIPFIMSGYYSLTEWNGIVISLLLAVALTQKFKFANVFRGIFFIPHIMSMTIVGFIWKFIFTQGFARLYEMTGWSFWNESWLGSPDLAFYSVVFVGIWQALGFYIVLYIAGLQAVPADVPEAAAVDGTGKIQRFFKVTLPLLGPSFTTYVFMSLTNSLNVFDIILALTKGGQSGAAYSATLQIYRDAFTNNQYGVGSAESMVYFVFVLVVAQLVLKLFSSREADL